MEAETSPISVEPRLAIPRGQCLAGRHFQNHESRAEPGREAAERRVSVPPNMGTRLASDAFPAMGLNESEG
jgi:hypothetical protein